MNETLLCFPVTNSEKERMQKVCRALGISQPEFLRRSLVEAEITIALSGHGDGGSEPGENGKPKKRDY